MRCHLLRRVPRPYPSHMAQRTPLLQRAIACRLPTSYISPFSPSALHGSFRCGAWWVQWLVVLFLLNHFPDRCSLKNYSPPTCFHLARRTLPPGYAVRTTLRPARLDAWCPDGGVDDGGLLDAAACACHHRLVLLPARPACAPDGAATGWITVYLVLRSRAPVGCDTIHRFTTCLTPLRHKRTDLLALL